MATGYKVFPYEGFGGGLNLNDGVDVVKQSDAIDALNVLYNTTGVVEERTGYSRFSQVEGTNRYDSLSPFYKSDGTRQIVAGAGTRLEGFDTAGNVIGVLAAGISTSPHYFQRFGGPTAEHLYVANGTDLLRRWDGGSFSTPTFVGFQPKGKFLGLSVTDNRLVNARFSGTVAGNNPSTVRFSDEGDPLTWGNTNYVDLTPGDGEEIMGVATWRDQVIVFKQTRFFVFYGNSTDDDGDPKFNYRPVDAGVGLVSPRALVSSEQGIYFLDRTGVYFTTGQQPERVSDAVRPIFHGGASVYYTGGILNDASISATTMTYHDERLWLSFPSDVSAVNNKQLVFDPHHNWWTLYDMPVGPVVSFRPGDNEELVFGYSSGAKHLGRHMQGSDITADDMDISGTGGNAIEAFWQSGWFDYGSRAVKTIREIKVAGSGLVNVEFFRDYRQTPARTSQVELSPATVLWDSGELWDSGLLWGPSGALTTRAIRKAIRGENFSVRFSNNTLNRSFAVHRLTIHIREVRVPSVVKVQ